MVKAFLQSIIVAALSIISLTASGRSDLCHWDESAQAWMLEPGELIIHVGSSSNQLPLQAKAAI